MSTFQEAFDKIKEGIKDMSSLEVVNYKGKISIEGEGAVPDNFDDIIGTDFFNNAFDFLKFFLCSVM